MKNKRYIRPMIEVYTLYPEPFLAFTSTEILVKGSADEGEDEPVKESSGGEYNGWYVGE